MILRLARKISSTLLLQNCSNNKNSDNHISTQVGILQFDRLSESFLKVTKTAKETLFLLLWVSKVLSSHRRTEIRLFPRHLLPSPLPHRLTPVKSWGKIFPNTLLAVQMGGKWAKWALMVVNDTSPPCLNAERSRLLL